MERKVDVAIIGAGSAGLTAMSVVRRYTESFVLIDGGELGTTCARVGCMPSKALLYASEVLHLARHAKTWGLRIPKAGFDFAKVMGRKDRMIEDFAVYRRKQLANAKFKFIRSNARFVDPQMATRKYLGMMASS